MPSPDAVLSNEAAAAPIPTPLWYDATADFLPPTAEWTNKVELADIDGDGRIDLLFANGGNYSEPGDVDGDGDLDLVLADWGPGNNMTNAGGRTRLWLNDGAGRFTDATEGRMPATLVRFSWDLELVDVDDDFDLDALVSCKRCGGSLLFRNDGTGAFEEDPRALPQYTNNYEFEAMDLDGDGFLDLVTINDGEIVGERGSSRRDPNHRPSPRPQQPVPGRGMAVRRGAAARRIRGGDGPHALVRRVSVAGADPAGGDGSHGVRRRRRQRDLRRVVAPALILLPAGPLDGLLPAVAHARVGCQHRTRAATPHLGSPAD
ncbi:FG-GAP repeat domain-containing protein [Candidatus Palauibacter sp.]|uniref:FG-GAP repeat domain-containing protein n=1 Tax=Candidatus Palauibacter sp. TaxID=3101350 RepID=UPI003B016183